MFKLIALAALAATQGPTSGADAQRLDFTSLGKARIGMSEQALAHALGAPLTHVAPEVETGGCYYASGHGLPDAVRLMMLDHRLARIDVSAPGVETAAGVGVGTAEAEVKRRYGDKLVEEPHAYTGPAGHYLTVQSADGKDGIRFETDGQAVTLFYAGTAKAIHYIEGCQ
jgi:hypothetical protein